MRSFQRLVTTLILVVVLGVFAGTQYEQKTNAQHARGGDPGVPHIVIAGASDVPALLTYPVADVPLTVGLGTKHALALYYDTSASQFKVTAWGLNDYGQTDVPAGLTDVGMLTGGRSFSLALKSDGTVVAWGKMYQHGPPSDSSAGTYVTASVPAGLSDVQTIVASNNVALALKTDGTVVQWGWAYCTLRGDAACPYDTAVEPPAGLSDVASIDINQTASRTRAVAIKHDGTVVTWGSSSYDQDKPASVPANSGVVLGETHALVISSPGGLSGWGLGSQRVVTGANAQPGTLANIAASAEYSFVSTNSTGALYGFGDTFPGTVPVLPPVGATRIAIASVKAKGDHLIVLYTDYTPPPTATATLNGSETASRTPTKTSSPTKTLTPSKTPTATKTPSATKAPKPSKTATKTRTATNTPSATRTRTRTPTLRVKPTKTPRVVP